MKWLRRTEDGYLEPSNEGKAFSGTRLCTPFHPSAAHDYDELANIRSVSRASYPCEESAPRIP
jgi:hypothetical protein